MFYVHKMSTCIGFIALYIPYIDHGDYIYIYIKIKDFKQGEMHTY